MHFSRLKIFCGVCRSFSNHVTNAILANKPMMAAMLLQLVNRVASKLFSCVNTLFWCNKYAWPLATWLIKLFYFFIETLKQHMRTCRFIPWWTSSVTPIMTHEVQLWRWGLHWGVSLHEKFSDLLLFYQETVMCARTAEMVVEHVVFFPSPTKEKFTINVPKTTRN